MNIASIVDIVEDTVGLDGVRYIALIGSYARGRREAKDVDMLLVVDEKLDLSKLVRLIDRNIAFTMFTVEELKGAPPDLKYSILHDSIPLYGSLDEIGDALKFVPRELLEWIYGDIAYYIYDCLDSLEEKNLRYAYRAAFTTAIKASWLTFIKHDLPLPNNSEETMSLLGKLTEKNRLYKRVLHDAKLSVLSKYDNAFRIFLPGVKINNAEAREAIKHTLSYVAELLRMSVSINSIYEDLEHAKRRIREAEETGDIRVLSDACQALFLVIYNSVSLYLTCKGIVPPERHGNRFRKLEELYGAFSEARIVQIIYRDAFDELHVSHYRRTCSVPLLKKWLAKTENFLKELKVWI